MNTVKYALLAGIGVATILLLTTDKGKKLRGDIADKAKDNVEKWKNRLADIGNGTVDALTELRELLDTEIEGLSDDARARIEKVIGKVAKNVKKGANKTVAA